MMRPGRVGHEAAHAAELADLALVTSGARVGHHPDRAEGIEAVHHRGRQVVGGLLPDVDDLLVALVVGDQAALELAVDLVDGGVGLDQARGLVGRDDDVVDGDGHAAAGGVLEADALDAVDDVGRLLRAEDAVALVDELAQLGPLHVHVLEAEPVRHDLVEDDPADGRLDPGVDGRSGFLVPGLDHRDRPARGG